VLGGCHKHRCKYLEQKHRFNHEEPENKNSVDRGLKCTATPSIHLLSMVSFVAFSGGARGHLENGIRHSEGSHNPFRSYTYFRDVQR
jgi:hypothetical protein